jgi:hypothetical protein
MDDSTDPGGELDGSTASGSTGKNDSSSVWGSGLLTNLGTLVKTGTSVYSSLNGKTAATAAKPASTAASSSSFTKYLPYIIGGVVLLAVVGFIFRGRK